MKVNTTGAIVAAALVGTVVLGACGTAATQTASTSSSAAPVSVTLPPSASVGTYQTTAPVVPPLNSQAAWVAEGNRMGDALILLNEVDKRLTMGGAGLRSYPVIEAMQLTSRLPDDAVYTFDDKNMRAGMTTTRGDKLDDPSVAVRVGLYRFDTPDVAKAVVADIAKKRAGLPKVAVPTARDAVAAVFKPGTIDTYLAVGSTVLNVSGTAPSNDEAASLVAKTYELELPKAQAFKPTPVSSVQQLPSNPDGIVGLNLPKNDTSYNAELSRGYFSLQGLLHRIADLGGADNYRKAGVDLVSQGGTVLYRTRDEVAARQLRTALYSASQMTPQAAPPGMPEITCVLRTTDKFYKCAVVVGRYFAEASSEGLLDAQRAATAEYLILKSKV